MVYPIARGGRNSRCANASGAGGQAALVECPAPAGSLLGQIPSGRALQYLDGGDRGDGHYDVLARGRAIDRATGAGVQKRGGRPTGPGAQCAADLAVIFDLSSGGRHALGFLPGSQLPNSTARTPSRFRHQSE